MLLYHLDSFEAPRRLKDWSRRRYRIGMWTSDSLASSIATS